MRTVAAWLALMFFVGPIFAQTASIGVKTGVPLTDLVRTSGEIGGYPFRADASRFTIGPALGFRLPHGLGFEFGAMYKRFPQKAGQVQIVAEPGTPFSTIYSPYSYTGQSWEFRCSANTAFHARESARTLKQVLPSITSVASLVLSERCPTNLPF
jgi:hypothetical protein